jgi:hypothetical protein
MRILLLFAFWGYFLPAGAQDPADIFHKTVDVEGVNQLAFDVYPTDSLEFRTWPGDDLLIETTVSIRNVKQDILDFYMRQNRYVLEPRVEGDAMTLSSFDNKRRLVKGTEGIAEERVMIVIYLPEDFGATGDGGFARVSR